MSGIRQLGAVMISAIIGLLAWFPVWAIFPLRAWVVPTKPGEDGDIGKLLIYLLGWGFSWVGWVVLTNKLIMEYPPEYN